MAKKTRKNPARPTATPQTTVEPRPRRNRLSLIILAACLAIFAVKAISSMVQESATWDETHYFGLGKYLLQSGRWDVQGSILHPPLSYYLHSIPLLFFPTDQALWRHDPARENDRMYRGTADVGRGQALLSSPENRDDRLLTLARLMMVGVGMLLGIFVFAWGNALYGPWGAITAIVLYAFCPNILAHSRLITPDIVITAFSFITMYLFWKMLRGGGLRYVLWSGIALGLALLSKYTGVLLIPICIMLAALAVWLHGKAPMRIRDCFIFGAIGAAVLLIGYRMNLEPWFAGIAFQQEHAKAGQMAFLSGEVSRGGWWYYYLLTFLLKTPVAAMALIAAALAVFLGTLRKKIATRDWTDELFLLVPAIGICAFFSVNHQSIGLRYILPIYPFLFVFAGGAVRAAASKKILLAPFSLLLAWHVVASTMIHPHYLAYFNELAGGPDNGYKYLVDSNLDWGQDLKGLGLYMREHGIPKISLSYFGSDSPDRYGIAYDWLPSLVLRNPTPDKKEVSLQQYVAISATNLQGVYFPNRDMFAQFRDRKPVAKIGYSIFVYDMNR